VIQTKLRGKQIPAWVLLMVILGGAAATVAGATATVLQGDTEIAVADKLILEKVLISNSTDEPANSTGVIHVANDRVSYMANFIADEGDTVIINITITNLAGIPTVVKICHETSADEYFDIGYSLLADNWTHPSGPAGSTARQLGNTLRNIDGEWVLFMPAESSVKVAQYIWIRTKPPTPAGQYEVYTWIQQKFTGEEDPGEPEE
jgi:hypothetical protein